MSFRLMYSQAAWLITASALLMSGCAHRISNDWPTDVNKVQWAVVTTGSNADPAKNLERLKAYNLALQGLVGVTSLEDQFIGCVGCDRLGTTAPPTELKYVFFTEHKKDLYAFTKAWENVQGSPLATATFTLTFNANGPLSGACPVAPPPGTCWPITSCTSNDGCDFDKTTRGCQKCPGQP